DAEACGGLHLQGLESTIGIIKIINSYRIHDGIDRLEYVAGPAMLDYINGVMSSIDRLAKLAGVDKDKLNKGIESKIKELDDYRKKYDQTIDRLSDYIASELAESSNSGVERTLDYDRSVLRLIATKYADMTGSMALLMNNSGEVVAISGGKANAKEAIERYAKEHGKRFKGGGSERIAEGMLV
ncbi:MAG: hypothetical protein ACP5FR_03990, partial [Candidatus Micrarchaeia archaeon]